MTAAERVMEERNEALFSFDRRRIEAYYRKYGYTRLPGEDKAFWAMVCGSILMIAGAPETVRRKANVMLEGCTAHLREREGYGGYRYGGTPAA